MLRHALVSTFLIIFVLHTVINYDILMALLSTDTEGRGHSHFNVLFRGQSHFS